MSVDSLDVEGMTDLTMWSCSCRSVYQTGLKSFLVCFVLLAKHMKIPVKI